MCASRPEGAMLGSVCIRVRLPRYSPVAFHGTRLALFYSGAIRSWQVAHRRISCVHGLALVAPSDAGTGKSLATHPLIRWQGWPIHYPNSPHDLLRVAGGRRPRRPRARRGSPLGSSGIRTSSFPVHGFPPPQAILHTSHCSSHLCSSGTSRAREVSRLQH